MQRMNENPSFLLLGTPRGNHFPLYTKSKKDQIFFAKQAMRIRLWNPPRHLMGFL